MCGVGDSIKSMCSVYKYKQHVSHFVDWTKKLMKIYKDYISLVLRLQSGVACGQHSVCAVITVTNVHAGDS